MNKEYKKYLVARRSVILIMIVTAIILSIGAVWYYIYDSQLLRNKKIQELRAVSGIKVHQITEWYTDEMHDAGLISKNSILVERIKYFLNNPDENSLKQLKILMEILINEHGYENICLADKNGRFLTCYDELITEHDSITNIFTQRVILENKVVSSDIYLSKINNKLLLDWYAPVHDENNQILAVVIFHTDPKDYLIPLISSWPSESKTSETLLVRQEGDSVIFLNELRHHKIQPLSLKISVEEKKIPAVQAVTGYEGIWEGPDYRGVNVLADIKHINGTPWYMIAKVDTDEIFEDLNYRQTVIIVFTIMLIAVFGLALAIVHQLRQKEVYKKLFFHEKALSEKEEEFRTTLYSIGDGVITTDTKGRIKQMNIVAEQLTGFKESEVAGKALESIFKIINEQTREAVENPVKKVLREGIVIGLANHTLLISKEGKEIPIADSGAPIRNKEGEIIGVVLIFRDQTSERETQKKLVERERSLNYAQELGKIGSWEIEAGTLNVKWSRQMFRMFGLDEHTNPPALEEFLEYLHPDDREYFKQSVKKLVRGEFPANDIFRSNPQNGEVRYYLPTFEVSKETGRNIKYAGTVLDITELKLKELALRRNEEIFKQLLLYSPLGIFLKDENFRYVMVSNYFEKLFGMPTGQIIGKKLEDFTEPEIAAKTLIDEKRILTENISLETESEFHDKNLEVIKFPISLPEGKTAIAGFVMDITNRKLAEKNIRTMSRGIEQNPASIIITDEDGHIQYVNPKFTEVSQYQVKEINGKVARILKPGILSDDEHKILWETIRSGKVWKGEFRNKRKDGELYWESVLISPIFDEKNLLTNHILISQDITELKKLIEELIVAKNEAEKADRVKSEFLAQMSHEIRTPINTIMSFISLLKEELSGSEVEYIKDSFRMIELGSMRITRTIDSILNMSELQAGSYEAKCEKIKIIADVLTPLLHEFKRYAQNKSLELEWNLEVNEIEFGCDGYTVTQLFANVIDNAIKYTKEGRIFILNGKDENNRNYISISDTGIGMSDEFMDKVFQPFVQEEQGYTRRFEGTGLGLSLVKKYAEINNLTIDLKSKKGEGTTFTILFPSNHSS